MPSVTDQTGLSGLEYDGRFLSWLTSRQPIPPFLGLPQPRSRRFSEALLPGQMIS